MISSRHKVNPLLDGLQNPFYLCNVYYSQSSEKASVHVMEYCPSNIVEYAKLNCMKDNQTRIAAAKNIGGQICEMLDCISSKSELIWTDMKPENILLRSNGKIAISNTSGFISNQFDTLFKVTKEYWPLSMRNGDYVFSNNANNFRTKWFKIYAYQLAIILYHQLTGNLIKNANKFSFKLPVFKSTEGKQFKFVIEGLVSNQVHLFEVGDWLNGKSHFTTSKKSKNSTLIIEKSLNKSLDTSSETDESNIKTTEALRNRLNAVNKKLDKVSTMAVNHPNRTETMSKLLHEAKNERLAIEREVVRLESGQIAEPKYKKLSSS